MRYNDPRGRAPRLDMLAAALIMVGLVLTAILAAVTALAACLGPPAQRGDPGQAAADRHVRSNVETLNANDPQRLGDVLPSS
jgi:hypothetical protein